MNRKRRLSALLIVAAGVGCLRAHAAQPSSIASPVLFNTPEADAILSTLQVFPQDNPWNQVISDWPLHPHSKQIVASVGNDKPLRCNLDMGFILVPPNQKRVSVKITDYAAESDNGPYPVPDNVPIETGDDRHAIVVDPMNRMLYEFYAMFRTADGWQAKQASIFDLKTNKLRPRGWTSADAAGLPIFPAVVRYDELERGQIDHALRVTVRRTRRDFVPPATHYASRETDENLPRMGDRFRLRQDFDVSGFSPEARTILITLKRHGMFVADNGIEWAISMAPDERIHLLSEELRRVKDSDFEVVVPPK